MSTTPVSPVLPESPLESISSNHLDQNCQALVDRRTRCYARNDLGEYHRDHDSEHKTKYAACWTPMLRAKRCLAFEHCAKEALDYYQSPSDRIVEGVNGPKDKGYCASYDEAYCFGNPRIMKIDLDPSAGGSKTKRQQKLRQETFDHHEKWKRRVANSKPKQGRCEGLRRALHKCLNEHLV